MAPFRAQPHPPHLSAGQMSSALNATFERSGAGFIAVYFWVTVYVVPRDLSAMWCAKDACEV